MDGSVPRPVRAGKPLKKMEKPTNHLPEQPAEPSGEPGNSETAAAEVLDRADLLERVEGDADLLSEMVTLFRQGRPAQLAAVRRAVAAGDARALENAAHALKGMVSNFAARRATEAALQLERMGREGNLLRAAEGFTLLEKEIERLESLLIELSRRVQP